MYIETPCTYFLEKLILYKNFQRYTLLFNTKYVYRLVMWKYESKAQVLNWKPKSSQGILIYIFLFFPLWKSSIYDSRKMSTPVEMKR